MTVSICLLSDGMHFGWQSPATKYLKNATNDSRVTDYTDDIDMAMQIIFLVGGVPFIPLCVFLADRIGRKWTNVLSSSVNVVSWGLIAIASTAYMFIVAKVLASICYCFDMIIIAMYASEIADKKIRGFLMAFILMSAMLGPIVMFAIFPFMEFWASALVPLALHVIHLCIFIILMPESPYYLLKVDKEERAEKSLAYFSGREDVSADLKVIETALAAQKESNTKFKDIWRDLHSRKALLLGCFLQFMVPMGGLSMVVMNIHSLLGDERVLFPNDYTSICFAGTLIISQIICMCILDYFGRKLLLLISTSGTSFALFAFALYFTIRDLHPDNDYSAVIWIPEISLIFYALFYRIGLGTVPTTLCAEMFPIKHKAAGVSITFVVMTIFDALVIVIFKQLSKVMHSYYCFYIFVGISLFNLPFVVFCVPETKGKTLAEIQEALGTSWGRKKNKEPPPEPVAETE